MAPRKGARSLKQIAQDSLVLSIVSKSVSADVLIEAPTHLAVSVMKRVTEQLEWIHKAQFKRCVALLKHSHCVSWPKFRGI
jgi:hypothetical protein